MKLSLGGLSSLLKSNAAELRFRRRRPGPGPFRRMLATNDLKLLQSIPGKLALNYRRPTGHPPYNPTQYNLLCVWDIFMQDFRMVPVDAVDVISVLPTTPPEQFWQYFNDKLSRMSATEKMSFMQN
jgi:hypothetical protein